MIAERLIGNVKNEQFLITLIHLCRGMLPEAVLPPSEDHTYAQWLEREDNKTIRSPQPSPFKRVPTTPHKHSPRGSPRAGSPRLSPRTPRVSGQSMWGSNSSPLDELGGVVDDVRKCGFCGEFGDKQESVSLISHSIVEIKVFSL